jgi:hypothetical protein
LILERNGDQELSWAGRGCRADTGIFSISREPHCVVTNLDRQLLHLFSARDAPGHKALAIVLAKVFPLSRSQYY